MIGVSSRLDVILRTADVTGVAPRTAVGIPPSDIDPYWDRMRVAIGGRVINRAFDTGVAVVTGAPIALVTVDGEPLVTMGGDPLVTVVG